MTDQKQKVLSLMRWAATGIALLYLGFFLVSFFWRRGSNEITMHVEWGIPDNPKFVIALALVCGASAAWLFRDTGKLISATLSIVLIAYQMWYWFVLTKNIKANTGLNTLPRAGWIGNQFIGGSVIDMVGLVGAVILLAFSLGRFFNSHPLQGSHPPGVAISR